MRSLWDYRLSWAKRLAHNARPETSGQVTLFEVIQERIQQNREYALR